MSLVALLLFTSLPSFAETIQIPNDANCTVVLESATAAPLAEFTKSRSAFGSKKARAEACRAAIRKCAKELYRNFRYAEGDAVACRVTKVEDAN